MNEKALISAQKVIEIHDEILRSEPGLHGDHGVGALEGALSRIQSRLEYENMDDVFEIAAMYGEALARGHVFNDANKRTALVTALTYLALQGFEVPRTDALEDLMVDVAKGEVERSYFADLLWSIYAENSAEESFDSISDK